MAHYALINSNNIVVQVITGVDENITQTDTNGTIVGGTTLAWEQFYASQPQFAGLTCKRTSYNKTFVQIMLVLDINMTQTLMYLLHHNHIHLGN
jgi:catabolite regulation protein CreA